MAAASAAHLGRARQEIETVCKLLIAASPEAIGGCEGSLAAAVGAMHEAREIWKKTPPEGREVLELKDLLRRIRMARKLLENGMEYREKWGRLLATMVGGYTAEGNPPPLCQTGQISVAG